MMRDPLEPIALRWMNNNSDDHIDPCNSRELLCTQLAEACADALNIYNDDADQTIPEWIFELAVEVETTRAENMTAREQSDYDDEEEQPALPGAEQVRDQEIATPAYALPEQTPIAFEFTGQPVPRAILASLLTDDHEE